MDWKIFIFLLSFNLKLVYCCNLFENKRTCECSILYSIGEEITKRKLFDLPSYDDCGINLGCEINDCGSKCLKSAWKLLGGREDFITTVGRDKVCDLVAKPNEQIASIKNGIKIWASWKYDNCRFGIEPVVQDVCCNRKCECRVISQDVMSLNSVSSSSNELADLINLLPVKEKSYYCSQISEIDKCKNDCLVATKNFFNNPNIELYYQTRHNLNIFLADQTSSNKVCQLIGAPKYKPGVDIFSEVSVGAGIPNSYISLGRVCCSNKCKCEYVFKDAFNGREVRASHLLAEYQQNQQIGYECSDEMSDCMKYCRENGFRFLNNVNPTIDKNETIAETDAFQVQPFTTFICGLLNENRPGDEQGFNIYIRYSNGDNNSIYPYKEDMHIGRVCCEPFLNQFVGFNRCDSTIVP
jgi:hypothetical protein